MRKLLPFLFGVAFVATAFAESNEIPFTDNLDGGKTGCVSSSGTEIKKAQLYEAGSDRFWKGFTVGTISCDAPKKCGCSITGERREKIKVKSAAGFDVEVDVPVVYEVFAHADCGTDPAKYLGKIISVECQVSATFVEYK